MSDHLHDEDRRAGLGTAIDQVGRVVNAPISEPATWSAQLRSGLDQLGWALDSHIVRTEAPDGLLHDIVDEAPRLAPRVQRARDDHAALRDLLAETRAALPARDDATVLDVRDRTIELLDALSRHQDLGSDLVYDACNVDMEAAD